MSAPPCHASFDARWPVLRAEMMAYEERYLRERLGPGGWQVPFLEEILVLRSAATDSLHLYRTGTPEQRQILREFFRTTYRPVIALAWRNAGAERKPTGTPEAVRELLREALGALSLEDTHHDFRDLLQSLGRIYLLACEAGIAPGPLVQEAASLSEAVRPLPMSVPMRRFLLEFERSRHFRETVQPALERIDRAGSGGGLPPPPPES